MTILQKEMDWWSWWRSDVPVLVQKLRDYDRDKRVEIKQERALALREAAQHLREDVLFVDDPRLARDHYATILEMMARDELKGSS